MKITKSQLKQIIQEELEGTLKEYLTPCTELVGIELKNIKK